MTQEERDIDIKMECLRIASVILGNSSADTVVEAAKQFEAFIKGENQ